MVATHDSVVVLQKVNKQVEVNIGNLSTIRAHKTKSRKTREQLKVVKQGRSTIPADIIVHT